jgi:hypothetical protein
MNGSIDSGRSQNLSTAPPIGSRARDCIVARRLIEETDPEPTLFTLERYAYRTWHTNLPPTPAGVWHFYDGRAGMEPRIRELREDFTLRKAPTRAFAVNALYLEVVRLAYNLVTAFQRTCLPEEWQSLTLSRNCATGYSGCLASSLAQITDLRYG